MQLDCGFQALGDHMGTYTTNYNLFMPTVGEQGWGDLVNGNFSTIDTTMKGLDTRLTPLEPLSVIQVDENQNVTFPAGVTFNDGVGGTINIDNKYFDTDAKSGFYIPSNTLYSTTNISSTYTVNYNSQINFINPLKFSAYVYVVRYDSTIAATSTLTIYLNDTLVTTLTGSGSNGVIDTTFDVPIKSGDVFKATCTATNAGWSSTKTHQFKIGVAGYYI